MGGSSSSGITSGLDRRGYKKGTSPGITIGGKFFPFGEKDEIPKDALDIINTNRQKFVTKDSNENVEDTQNLGAFQSGLAGQQAQLGAQTHALQGTDIQRLGSLGALNQAQAQAQLDAQREAARQATFLPQEQLDRFAGQVTGIMGGYPAQFQSTVTPNPTPLQTALGVGTTLAGIYGATRPGANTTFSLTG